MIKLDEYNMTTDFSNAIFSMLLIDDSSIADSSIVAPEQVHDICFTKIVGV